MNALKIKVQQKRWDCEGWGGIVEKKDSAPLLLTLAYDEGESTHP